MPAEDLHPKPLNCSKTASLPQQRSPMSRLILLRTIKMRQDLVVAVASGKGGTGKTTIAVNLAQVVSELGQKIQYLDCDVEEPNGHIFYSRK